jgi:hypothetical protein
MSIPTFAATMKAVFGQNQSAGDFMKEFKALSEKDKEDYHRILNAEGYTCAPPSKSPV